MCLVYFLFQVHPKNASTIAVNIKNMKEKDIEWPSLTSHLASQMLLEIGVEKLKRDYVYFFAGKIPFLINPNFSLYLCSIKISKDSSII